jgi:hypothetical protein
MSPAEIKVGDIRAILEQNNDAPDERYGTAVEASLKSRGTKYRVVGFKDVRRLIEPDWACCGFIPTSETSRSRGSN